MKRQKPVDTSTANLFDLLSEEITLTISDFIGTDPFDRKSFSLVCKSFYLIESEHRKNLKPLRQEHLPRILNRHPHVSHLDLSLCPRVNDNSLALISNTCKNSLNSIDLSRSRFFSYNGLMDLALNCKYLVSIDLSNTTELRDAAASAVAEAKNLERLWLGRCKLITGMGIGCIAVGCKKLRLISLKWCLGLADLGVGLIAVKCTEIRSLDLSYLPITNKCLPSILKLQYLDDLILEGCFGNDDHNFEALKHGCKSLKAIDMSSCHNISHVGLPSLISGAGSLRQLTLAYGSPVTVALASSLKKLSMLQSVRLDGCMVTSTGLMTIGNCSISLSELSLSKCLGVTDEGLSSLVTKLKDLKRLDITCCRKITDVSISHITSSCTSLASLRMESCTLVPSEVFVLIGQRCRFLEELDLTDNEIDDEGLKSISRCFKLSSLKLGICLNISDEGLSHIGMKCSKLTELDLYRSSGMTDLGILAISQGVAAIAVGCRQLNKLDTKKCHNIGDAAMLLPLAHFSQNLRQITLSYSSVTDVGLLALASISCLQCMTVLHLKGLTPSGLAAALLACRGLTKVKLHLSFKSLLPQPLFEHLEARGCVLEWRDKEFQDELDPKCYKLQLEDI